MSTRAFDLALYVPATPQHAQDGAVVASLGPPFTTTFMPLVVGSVPGISLGASVPAPTAQNQILLSGAGPTFAWGLGTNPAVGGATPPPVAQNHILLADAVPSWQDSTIANLLAIGNAVLTTASATFATAVKHTFTASATLTTRLDGSDPALSQLDNFSMDAGTF
jgi:hypothetical protein